MYYLYIYVINVGNRHPLARVVVPGVVPIRKTAKSVCGAGLTLLPNTEPYLTTAPQWSRRTNKRITKSILRRYGSDGEWRWVKRAT